MDFSQIELLAFKSSPLPSSCNTIERACYQAMEFLHMKYRAGMIDREYAALQKRQIRDAYESDMLIYRMYLIESERQRKISDMVLQVQYSGCDICRKVLAILDGRSK